MSDLFGGDEDSNVEFNLNTQYAKRYDTWRQKEVIETLKARYGDQGDDGSSSSEEDELGVELTPQVEKDFFRTLSCLKSKDPLMYDASHKFFADRDEAALARVKPDKPVFLRDYERQRILLHDGIDVDEEEHVPRSQSPSLAQEQRDLVAGFRKVLDEDSDDDDLLATRQRKPAEVAADEESYATWLRGKSDQLGDAKAETELKTLRDFWTDPALAEGEAFLKDYILGKRYLATNQRLEDEDVLSEDEAEVSKQESFEHRFNFRFEHPDAALIQTYPRTMDNSLRRKDTRRKEQRLATKSRHEQRREAQVQELMQLKALKRKEIQDRIDALKKVTGNDTLGFQESDVEGEFDGSKHDARMAALFADEYYGGAADEEEKPEFPDLDAELELERWDDVGQAQTAAASTRSERREQRDDQEEEEEEEEGPHCEDEEFNMDADFDPNAVRRKRETSKKNRKRRVPLLSAALARDKPIFDPADGTFDAFLDEYYAMDFEDIVGGMPCRFKYRQVAPNDFGLTIDEILTADDKELNAWASLKKATTLRPDWLERKDQISYKNRGQNEAYKRKILTSLYQPREEWQPEEGEVEKKRKKAGGKKKRGERDLQDIAEGTEEPEEKRKKKRSEEGNEGGEGLDCKVEGGQENGEAKKKKKKKKHRQEESDGETSTEVKIEEQEMQGGFEIGEIKKKKKKKHHPEENDVETKTEIKTEKEMHDGFENGEVKKKKKKKHRQDENDVEKYHTEVKIEGQDMEGEVNKELKKKKKKMHRQEKEEEEEDEVDIKVQKSDLGVETEQVNKKKAKKHREMENDKSGEKTEETNVGLGTTHELTKVAKKRKREEGELINGASKTKKTKLEAGPDSKGKAKKTKKKKKKNKKKSLGSGGAVCKEGEERKVLKEGEMSRRKKKNLKLQAQHKLEPKVEPKLAEPKRRRRRDPAAAGQEAQPAFSETRLAAYGLKRPKRFLNYIKYKDKDVPTTQ